MNASVSGLSPWLILIGLGAFHGLNPAMGWLFAVALGLYRQSRAVMLASLIPIALGHALAIAVVVGTMLWTTLLFAVSLSLGGLIMTQLGAWRWPGGILAGLAILGIGHWIAARRTGADQPGVSE